MYPHERSLVKQLADRPFALIGINSDDNLDEIRQIVKEKNLTWRSFQNTQVSYSISNDWGVQGWPTTYLLDHEGRIRYYNVRGTALDRALEELLGEMGHEIKIVHPKEKKETNDSDADDIDNGEKRA